MTTRNLVPRATGEGQLGTTSKKWNQGHFNQGHFTSLNLGGTAITATAAEINYLDVTTLGTSEASKAITVNSIGDLIVPDGDKFQFGTGSDMTLYHDGTNSYLTNKTGALKIATETSGIAVTIGHATSEVTIGDNLTVTGNLTVNGNTTMVNSTVTTVDDPIITLGGDTAPSSDDNLDRGVEFRWHNGSAAKVGFFGYDDSTSKFTFIQDATNSSEVFSGSAGNVAFGSGDFTGNITLDNQGTLILSELDSNGSNTISLKAPAAVTANTVLTLPDGAGTNGQSLTTNGSGTLSWTTIEQTVTGLTDVDITSPQGGQILVYDGTNTWDNKTLSGDATIAANGALTISADSIEGSMLNDNIISGQTEMTGDVADADELLVSDAGTIKRADFSVVRDAVYNDISGDATVAAGGALTIAANAVHDSMLNDDVATGLAGDGLAASSGVLSVGVDDSSIETNSDALRVKASGITNAMLAGSIADSKLNTISTAGKVALSSLEIDGGTDIGAALVDADLIIVDDGAGGTNRKAALSRVKTYVGASAGAFSIDNLDLDGGTDIGADLVDADLVLVDDGAGGTNRKSTLTRVKKYIYSGISGDAGVTASGALTIAANSIEGSMIHSNAAGDGIAYSSNTLSLDLNELTAAAVDVVNDSIAIIDASDNTSKKEAIADVITAIAGDGLVASSGVLSIGVDDSSIETNSDALRVKDAGITLSKMANIDNMKVIGNVSGGAATPSAISILDEDTLSTNSNTALATQQSIKAYVDSQIAGLDVKASVVAASTSSFTMASTASSSTLVLADGEGGFNATANTLTIDGQSISADSRVLIKDGVNSNSAGVHNKWNGVYIVGSLTGSNCTLTRSTDFNEPNEFTGAPYFMVDSGTVNGAHGFVCNITSNPTLGTDPITFYQFSAPGQDSVAGSGLSMSGNIMSVDIDELTALGSATIAQADNFIVSDSGTEKKVTFSNLEDTIFSSVSGDATIAAGGALAIASGAISKDELNKTSITTQTAETSVADDDEILVYDTSVGELRKMTKQSFVTGTIAGSVKSDDISLGDAAVTIATSTGNITIDAQGNDTDIIFKGTDNNSDITMLTLDASEAGLAIFGGNITIPDGGKIGSSTTGSAIEISAQGLVKIDSSQQSTSATSGALKVDGGAGIAGNLWVGNNLYGSLVSPHGSTKTITVTVAAKSSSHRYNGTGSSSGYKLDGVESPYLTLTPGRTYKFDQADSSNSGHPLRFYYEADETTAYTTGVTTNGTPGSSGAYTQIVVSDTTPLVLHYQCSAHGYMGNSVNTSSSAATRLDLAGTTVTASGAEINVLDGVTAGTVTASKALVADSNKDLGTIRNLTIDGTFTDGNYTFDTSGNVSGLGTVSSGAITSTGTSTFAGGVTPAAADGAALGSTSAEWSDLYLADGGQILLGNDQDVTLTHVADTGLLLNSTRQLQFGDSGTYIHQSADGVLDLVSDTEIEINANAIDINATAGITMDGTTLSIDGTDDSNLTVTGSAKDLDIAVAGGGTQELRITSAGTGASALHLNASAGGINIDSADMIDIDAADEITINTTSADGHITITSAHTAGDAILISANADAGSILDVDAGIMDVDVQGTYTLDATGISLDSDAASNFTTSSGALTLSGAGGVDITSDLSVSGDTSTFSSANSTDPLIIIKNTTNDANGARLRFVKDKGAAGAANDVAGLIEFYADDANQDQVKFSEIKSQVAVHTNGQEGGKLTLSVAENDGTLTQGLLLSDGDADGEIDVTIGAGTSSVTTVSGKISLGTVTYDFPTSDGSADQVLKTDGSGNLDWVAQSGGSGGGGFTYELKTSSFTAEASYHYGVNANGGAITMSLPARASGNDDKEIRVKLKDATNALTITAAGSDKIDGSLNDVTLSVENQSITIVASQEDNNTPEPTRSWEIV